MAPPWCRPRRGTRRAGGRRVPCRVLRLDLLGSDERRGAEAEGDRHQVESADDADGPVHGLTGGLGGRDGVEADQDVREPGGAEDERDTERDEVQLRDVRGAVLEARLQEGRTVTALLRSGAEQVGDVEVELPQHHQRHQQGAGDEQDGLDHLHPGGALHAADRDVDDHEDADERHDEDLARVAGDAEQQRDEDARARHLGQQVEDRHDDGGDTGGGAHRPLAHPVGEDVAHGVAAGVAQGFGDEQQGYEPGDEEADGVEEAVVAEEGDGAGDAEEGRRRHVVAGDGESVLEGGELPAARVEVRRALGLPAGPDGDAQGRGDEDGEERDDQRPVFRRRRRRGELDHGVRCVRGAHASASRRDLMAAACGSSLFVAWRE